VYSDYPGFTWLQRAQEIDDVLLLLVGQPIELIDDPVRLAVSVAPARVSLS
jgi:hypothetical protein